MTSLEQIQITLDLKVLQQKMGALESAATRKDVAGMLAAANTVLPKVQELIERLQRVYDSAEYMHSPGGEHDENG